MTDEKWQDLIGRIKDTFTVEETFSDQLENEPGLREGILFASPRGRMKLERVTRPVVLDTKALTAKRIGASSTIQKEYSETENTQTVALSLWDGNAWQQLDLDAAAMLDSAS